MLFASCENESVDSNFSSVINDESSVNQNLKTILYNGQTIDVIKEDNFYLWGDILIPEREIYNNKLCRIIRTG